MTVTTVAAATGPQRCSIMEFGSGADAGTFIATAIPKAMDDTSTAGRFEVLIPRGSTAG
jgi:hypothetical protein